MRLTRWLDAFFFVMELKKHNRGSNADLKDYSLTGDMVRNVLDARKQGGRDETVRFGTARSGQRC